MTHICYLVPAFVTIHTSNNNIYFIFTLIHILGMVVMLQCLWKPSMNRLAPWHKYPHMSLFDSISLPSRPKSE